MRRLRPDRAALLGGQRACPWTQRAPLRVQEVVQVTVLPRSHYAAGLAAYRARRFADARDAFNAALQAVPTDGPSRTLLARIAQMEVQPPADGWDGAWRFEQK